MRKAKAAMPQQQQPMRKSGVTQSSFGRNLVIVLLSGIAGYNLYETAQLKQEVADLRQKRHVQSSPTQDESAAPPRSLLEQARKHVSDAELLLQTKDYERARASLAAGVQSLQRANVQARSEGDTILTQLRNATQRLGSSAPKPAAKEDSKEDGAVAH